ncbi:hypothetical protein BVG19_g261 [[Candida] boidinii]|nr:hypothetical protein BVG19_g261 [[Candida] boidinii]OWB49754.1 hypothetical protein B5S27_g1298 [[Candida] boidinii]
MSSNEISISIEETNKIRSKLGLSLIPTTNGNSGSNNNNKDKDIQKREYNESLSIIETNKIRLKLGLKPIPGPNNLSLQGENQGDDEDENYKEFISQSEKLIRDEKKLSDLQSKKYELSKSKLLNQKDNLFSDLNDTDDTEWINNIGNGNKKDTLASKRNFTKKTNQKKVNETGGDVSVDNITIMHDLNSFKNHIEDQQKDVILTLKDESIFGNGENDDDKDNGNFENVELSEKLKIKEILNEKINNNDNKRKLIGEDGFEDYEDNDKFEIVQGSFNISNGISRNNKPLDEDQDKDGEIEINKIVKRKKTGNLVLFDEDNEFEDDFKTDISNQFSKSDYKTVKFKKINKKLLKNKNKRKIVTNDDDENENEIKEQKIFKKVKLSEFNNSEIDFDRDELSNFINKNRSKKVIVKDFENEKEMGIDNKEDLSDDGGIIIDEDEEFFGTLKVSPEDEVSSNNSSLGSKDTIRVTPSVSPSETYPSKDADKLEVKIENVIHKDSVNEEDDSVGLGSMLRLLNQNKNEVNNNGKNANKNFKVDNNYNPDIKIRYTDDKGKELDKKQAFKYLSHKFHGFKK